MSIKSTHIFVGRVIDDVLFNGNFWVCERLEDHIMAL